MQYFEVYFARNDVKIEFKEDFCKCSERSTPEERVCERAPPNSARPRQNSPLIFDVRKAQIVLSVERAANMQIFVRTGEWPPKWDGINFIFGGYKYGPMTAN